jgi:rubrerythrin
MNPAPWNQLADQNERKIAHLAQITRNGPAKALVIAHHCSQWNAEEIVSEIYSRSTGKHSEDWEAWRCPECGQVHLGTEAALDCCAEAAEEDFGEYDEELGVSDDNWACGTLDPST